MHRFSLLCLLIVASHTVPAEGDTPVIATKKYVDSGLAARVKNTVFDSFKTSAESAIGGKQDKITATGAVNLLTAPSVAGGQPGTKPIGDFAPSSITTTAPAASSAQDPGAAEPITVKIQRAANNIADIYNKLPSGNAKVFSNEYRGPGAFTRTFVIHNCMAITSINGSGKLNTGTSAAQRWVDNGVETQGNAKYSLQMGTLNTDWTLTLTATGSAGASAVWTTIIQGIFSGVDVL
ncbi:MAG: hypothetical protein LBB08_01750 [Rickettsiales bacterium]|jgi:hypothetical protein|nr:hypothetical protein [Rickettsiales bacterium]